MFLGECDTVEFWYCFRLRIRPPLQGVAGGIYGTVPRNRAKLGRARKGQRPLISVYKSALEKYLLVEA